MWVGTQHCNSCEKGDTNGQIHVDTYANKADSTAVWIVDTRAVSLDQLANGLIWIGADKQGVKPRIGVAWRDTRGLGLTSLKECPDALILGRPCKVDVKTRVTRLDSWVEVGDGRNSDNTAPQRGGNKLDKLHC